MDHESSRVENAKRPIFLARFLEYLALVVDEKQVGWLDQFEVQALFETVEIGMDVTT
jgi:hypothetical protein